MNCVQSSVVNVKFPSRLRAGIRASAAYSAAASASYSLAARRPDFMEAAIVRIGRSG